MMCTAQHGTACLMIKPEWQRRQICKITGACPTNLGRAPLSLDTAPLPLGTSWHFRIIVTCRHSLQCQLAHSLANTFRTNWKKSVLCIRFFESAVLDERRRSAHEVRHVEKAFEQLAAPRESLRLTVFLNDWERRSCSDAALGLWSTNYPLHGPLRCMSANKLRLEGGNDTCTCMSEWLTDSFH